MAAQGAKVIIADLKEVEAGSLPKNISALHLDISDEASIRDLVASVVDKYGRLDVAINSTFFSTIFSSMTFSMLWPRISSSPTSP